MIKVDGNVLISCVVNVMADLCSVLELFFINKIQDFCITKYKKKFLK